jgi:acetylglutamate kinase
VTEHSTILVKIGGSTLGAHDTSLDDVSQLQLSGRKVVIVHGGGPAISSWLTRLQTPTRFVRGLRVTDGPALEVVAAVLAGLVNKQLVAELGARGARVAGLSGADGGLFDTVYEDEELGYVGRVTDVHPDLVHTLLSAGYMPVIAPLAVLGNGGNQQQAQLLNVNADTMAGDLACALQAERLVFLTDVEGVRGADGAVLRRIAASETAALLTAGVISGGMIPKVEAGLKAASAGTSAVIVDGRLPHSLLHALEADPPGTLILEAGLQGGGTI